jgi:hypothetical protein
MLRKRMQVCLQALRRCFQRSRQRQAFLTLLLCLAMTSIARAANGAANGEDLDVYKWRVSGVWWFSHPTGSFSGKANSGTFDLNRDFKFGNYSTFSGLADWRFKRKHHLLFGANPVTSSRRVTLSRTIEFQAATYDVGTSASAEIKSLAFAPGYQYDIIRRNRISISLATQCYLIWTKATLSGTATVNGQSQSRTASGSLLAPLPILGPRVRWYPMRSGRLALEGDVLGMGFFGYGNFLTARGTANISLSRHWRLNLGYQMGTRLRIEGGTNQIGIRLTQKGPIAGFEAFW